MYTMAAMCSICRHRHELDTCAAFPNGIPDDILLAFVDHRQPVEGDQGIQFELREGVSQQDADALASIFD